MEDGAPQPEPAAKPSEPRPPVHVVRPSPEVISEFRRRAARREAGLDGDLPELRWFAEGVLMGLWGADGVRVVEGVTAGLGRADWVDGFHSALALAMRRLASRLRPAGSPLTGRLCTAAPPRGFVVALRPLAGTQALALPHTVPPRIVLDAGDALWCDGTRCALDARGGREL